VKGASGCRQTVMNDPGAQQPSQMFYINQIRTQKKRKMSDNINLLINKKRPSSHIEKLRVDNKQYE